MRFLNLFGSLPNLLSENTAPWDWLGQLRLSIDPGQIRFVDIIGSGADFFDATLNRGLGTIVVTPFARADFESFLRDGRTPELSLTLRFFMQDGTVAQSTQSFTVGLLDLDDTPPEALALENTGAVPTGVAGAVIGRLVVSDPDTASGFTFTIREDDRWLFEVANGSLRLKPGMVLSDGDGPVRHVTIDVSDGHQSAALTVSFNVTDPRAPSGQLANLLLPGRAQAGFSWSGDGVLRGDVTSSDLASIRDYGSLLQVTLDSGDSLWVDQPRVIDLLDGRIFYGPANAASRVWNIFETTLNREPTMKEMQGCIAWLEAGNSEMSLLRMAAAALGGVSNEQLPIKLYQNSVGWVDHGGAAYHTQRLDAGVPREQILLDFLDWRRGGGHEAARAEQGIFVPRPNAHQVDILLEVGANIPSGAATRWWIDQVNAGTLNLGVLANVVTTLDGFRQGVGALDPWSFAAQFFRTALGRDFDPAAAKAWGDGFAGGTLSRATFMEAVANGVNFADFVGAPVFEKPDAPAFDPAWF